MDEIGRSYPTVLEADNFIYQSELEGDVSSFFSVLFFDSRKFRTDEIWVRRELDPHDLVSL